MPLFIIEIYHKNIITLLKVAFNYFELVAYINEADCFYKNC